MLSFAIAEPPVKAPWKELRCTSFRSIGSRLIFESFQESVPTASRVPNSERSSLLHVVPRGSPKPSTLNPNPPLNAGIYILKHVQGSAVTSKALKLQWLKIVLDHGIPNMSKVYDAELSIKSY